MSRSAYHGIASFHSCSTGTSWPNSSLLSAANAFACSREQNVRILVHVQTTSSQHRAAGNGKRARGPDTGLRSDPPSNVRSARRCGQDVSTTTVRPRAAAMPIESHAQPPHHRLSPSRTAKPIGAVEKDEPFGLRRDRPTERSDVACEARSGSLGHSPASHRVGAQPRGLMAPALPQLAQARPELPARGPARPTSRRNLDAGRGDTGQRFGGSCLRSGCIVLTC
jgi:hypothetical protein